MYLRDEERLVNAAEVFAQAADKFSQAMLGIATTFAVAVAVLDALVERNDEEKS